MPRHDAAATLVLLSHGSRDPAWADPVRAIRDRILQDQPSRHVTLAFLEFMPPRLTDAIDTLATSGATDIVIAPLFLGQGGHLKRDVLALVEECRARHPGIPIVLAPALGESTEVRSAIARWLTAL